MFGKECYKDINRILNEKLQEKKACRCTSGVRGGNIRKIPLPRLTRSGYGRRSF